MNEVDKMYKLANVQPQYKKRIKCKEGHSIGQPCGKSPCIDCDKSVFEDVMPPFTAEKQLELIKWIAENKEECRITYDKEYKWCTQTDWQSSFCYDNFSASLAGLVNNLWQDLAEEERKQIKNVLEG